jgi:hypothetical protein
MQRMDAPQRSSPAGASRRFGWRVGVRWMLFGLAMSLPVHALVLVWLALTSVERPGAPEAARSTIELAVLPDDAAVADAPPAPDRASPRAGDATATVPADAPAVAVEGLFAVGMEEGTGLDGGDGSGLGGFGPGGGGGDGFGGGGGGGEGGGLGGGAGGTSFFGIGGRGTRFAFIVDKSGSMGGRMQEAKDELQRAIAGLPDYASVFIVFYDSGPSIVFSSRWERVRSGMMQRLKTWMRQVGPGGGTQPMDAFLQVYSLDIRPDVIFFLSDGAIPEETIDAVRQLNSRGKRVTVNTVSFGDQRGSMQLRQIAQQADGQFREVLPGQVQPAPRGGGRP